MIDKLKKSKKAWMKFRTFLRIQSHMQSKVSRFNKWHPEQQYGILLRFLDEQEVYVYVEHMWDVYRPKGQQARWNAYVCKPVTDGGETMQVKNMRQVKIGYKYTYKRRVEALQAGLISGFKTLNNLSNNTE